jgi:hypothetical protein
MGRRSPIYFVYPAAGLTSWLGIGFGSGQIPFKDIEVPVQLPDCTGALPRPGLSGGFKDAISMARCEMDRDFL